MQGLLLEQKIFPREQLRMQQEAQILIVLNRFYHPIFAKMQIYGKEINIFFNTNGMGDFNQANLQI